jgi:hypothetical protein
LGLDFLQAFYHGSTLQFGPTLLMILLTLVGSFMAFTGIILNSISKMMNESKKDPESPSGLVGLKRHAYRNSYRSPARVD